MGMYNSLWLVFVYGTAPVRDDTQEINDPVVRITIANIPSGCWPRFVAATVATYIFFIYAMFLVFKDFEWYTHMRHKVLQLAQPRNYAVFVRNIPKRYRDNRALEGFMRSCFSNDAVVEAHVAVTTDQLAKVEADRDSVLAKLEHAMAEYEVTGRRPTHKEGLGVLGQTVDSIETYERQLMQLNDQVDRRINGIEEKIRAMQSSSAEWCGVRNLTRSDLIPNGRNSQEDDPERIALIVRETESTSSTKSRTLGEALDAVRTMATDAVGDALDTAAEAIGHVENIASEAAAIITGVEDGVAYPAGFVIFSNLATANAALQMVHHPTPFALQVSQAPDPADSKYGNLVCKESDRRTNISLSFLHRQFIGPTYRKHTSPCRLVSSCHLE